MPNTREKLVELLEQSLIHKETGREMRFTGGDVTPVIANGVTVQKWIPVTERLPDDEGSYLVYSRKSKTVFTAHYRPNISKWANRANGQFITHWMPLPEPPKGE